MRLLAIDPGVRALGVALFEDGALAYASYAPAFCPNVPIDVLAIEVPQIYARRRTRQQDLVNLAVVVGRVVESVGAGETTYYLPRQWKGQVPKEVMCRRVQSRLTAEETARVYLPPQKSKHHNVWDAVGIGLHYLGRLGKRR